MNTTVTEINRMLTDAEVDLEVLYQEVHEANTKFLVLGVGEQGYFSGIFHINRLHGVIPNANTCIVAGPSYEWPEKVPPSAYPHLWENFCTFSWRCGSCGHTTTREPMYPLGNNGWSCEQCINNYLD